jgi:DNA-binding NarL/FixJ family response regulator
LWLAIAEMDREVSSASKGHDVALVCAPELLRLGLARVLVRAPGLEVRAVASLAAVPEPCQVMVLCERGLGDAAAACAFARERLAEEVVLVLAEADVHLMLDCLAAGACGFSLESDGAGELIAAVRAAVEGEYFVAPRLLTLMLDRERVSRASVTERARAAERELLRLLAGGRSTSEIAAALGVAPKTVRNRASALYRRLGVHSRAGAVEAAERRGLLD